MVEGHPSSGGGPVSLIGSGWMRGILERLGEELDRSSPLGEYEFGELMTAYQFNMDYPELKEAFMEALSEEVSVQLKDGSTIPGLVLRCPFCSRVLKLAYLTEEAEEWADYQHLLSELKMHLYEHHGFGLLMSKVQGGDRGVRTTYRCNVCGEKVRGVIEAVCHIMFHIQAEDEPYFDFVDFDEESDRDVQ